MKPLTLWQRLTTAQFALLALLLVGVGLALWIERTRSEASHRSDQLSAGAAQLHYDLVLLSSSLRGLLLNPKSESDEKQRLAAENDLQVTLENLQDNYRGEAALAVALRNLRSYTHATLTPFHAETLRRLASDPQAASDYYLQTQPAIRKRRDELYSELLQQVGRIKNAEAIRAGNIAIIGGVFILAVLVATIIVGRYQSSAVSAPLQRLVGALERMRRGDFTQRIPQDRADEFGVLGEGLNRLAEDLSVLVGQVQRSGIQVTTTSTEIAATAKEQQTTAAEIAATTAQIGATSREISATSQELVKTMNEVAGVAAETAQLAGSGQSGISRMEGAMRQILEASGGITAKLAVLSEKTANIETVVTTITRVADQTNLLSLNAAIEAEKAGEYGLGFAVVAMEIRRLADQTAVATYDIEKMAKEMQTAVAAGVMGMDKYTEEVRRGVEENRQVSGQLSGIIRQVQTLTPRIQTVNEGMHAQATGAEQISEALTQLSDAAQQTAETLRQSNLAIEQLSEAARGLQTSVTRFKLDGSQ